MESEQLLPRQLPMVELERYCRAETLKRRRQETDDPRYCLEIFRRALAIPADHEARETLVALYTSFIEAKLPASPLVMAITSREDLVQDTWFFFWRAARNGRLTFRTLPQALAYLGLARKSAVFNALRSARKPEQSLESEAEIADPMADPFSGMIKQAFLERLRVVVDDPLHSRIFWLRYHDELPPRQIAELLNRERVSLDGQSPTAQAISQLLYQLCRRLEQDAEIQRLLKND